jgi:hypothetical protein
MRNDALWEFRVRGKLGKAGIGMLVSGKKHWRGEERREDEKKDNAETQRALRFAETRKDERGTTGDGEVSRSIGLLGLQRKSGGKTAALHERRTARISCATLGRETLGG